MLVRAVDPSDAQAAASAALDKAAAAASEAASKATASAKDAAGKLKGAINQATLDVDIKQLCEWPRGVAVGP